MTMLTQRFFDDLKEVKSLRTKLQDTPLDGLNPHSRLFEQAWSRRIRLHKKIAQIIQNGAGIDFHPLTPGDKN